MSKIKFLMIENENDVEIMFISLTMRGRRTTMKYKKYKKEKKGEGGAVGRRGGLPVLFPCTLQG